MDYSDQLYKLDNLNLYIWQVGTVKCSPYCPSNGMTKVTQLKI